jgi:hypothetical protein
VSECIFGLIRRLKRLPIRTRSTTSSIFWDSVLNRILVARYFQGGYALTYLELLPWTLWERDPLHRCHKTRDPISKNPCAFAWPREIEQRPGSCCRISNHPFQVRSNKLRNHVHHRKLHLASMGRLWACTVAYRKEYCSEDDSKRETCTTLQVNMYSRNDVGTNRSCSWSTIDYDAWDRAWDGFRSSSCCDSQRCDTARRPIFLKERACKGTRWVRVYVWVAIPNTDLTRQQLASSTRQSLETLPSYPDIRYPQGLSILLHE